MVTHQVKNFGSWPHPTKSFDIPYFDAKKLLDIDPQTLTWGFIRPKPWAHGSPYLYFQVGSHQPRIFHMHNIYHRLYSTIFDGQQPGSPHPYLGVLLGDLCRDMPSLSTLLLLSLLGDITDDRFRLLRSMLAFCVLSVSCCALCLNGRWYWHDFFCIWQLSARMC